MELKTRETSNAVRSPEIPDGRVHVLQRFAILMGEDGGNRPLGEREAVERKKGSVAVKIEERSVLTDPPRYIWDGFTIRSIRTYVRNIRLPLNLRRISMKDRIEF
jgi:hypothetical protein